MMQRLLKVVAGGITVAAAGSFVHDQTVHLKPTPTDPPLPDADDYVFPCTPNWMTQVMKLPVGSVSQVSTEPISGGATGPVLHRIRMTPTQSLSEELKSKIPESVVAKFLLLKTLPPRDFGERIFCLFFSTEELIHKEVEFYHGMQEKIKDIGVASPNCYFAAYECAGRRSPLYTLFADARPWTKMCLLLEDLNGYQHYSLGTFVSEEDAIETAKTLAKLHSAYWNTSVKEWETYRPSIYSIFFTNKFLARVAMNDKFADKIVTDWENNEFLRPLLNTENKEEARKIFQAIYKNYPLIAPYLTHEPTKEGSDLFRNTTLIHGDMHTGNLFFGRDKNHKSVVVCDWQGYGYGHAATEFAYFLGFAVKFNPELDKKLREVYYEELTRDHGDGLSVKKEEYPFSVFEREVAVRVVGLATGLGSIFYSDTPEKRITRNQKNPKFAELDRGISPLIDNSCRRAYHLLTDTENDFKTLVLGRSKEE